MATTQTRVHSTWNATIRTALGAAAAVTLILLAFAWPTYTAKAKDMRVAVVGTAQQRSAVAERLSKAGGAFTVRTEPDRQSAVHAIEHRDAYGAIILPSGKDARTEVLTASAASPLANQALTGAAQGMSAQQMKAVAQRKQQGATQVAQLGAQAAAAQSAAQTLERVSGRLGPNAAAALAPQLQAARAKAQQLGTQVTQAQQALASAPTPSVTITDVVPLSSHDSRGAGLAISGLPLAMGGMIGGSMISMLVVGWKRHLVATAGYGILGGLGMTIVLHSWFAFVQGSFWTTWLVTGLAIAATASFIVGAQALIGNAGIGIGAVVTMFLGNPLSSVQMPGEWLPWAWGTIGQFLVPGAAGTLLRLESYFPHASTLREWLVLWGWLLVGVVLTILGRHKDDEVIHIAGATEPEGEGEGGQGGATAVAGGAPAGSHEHGYRPRHARKG